MPRWFKKRWQPSRNSAPFTGAQFQGRLLGRKTIRSRQEQIVATVSALLSSGTFRRSSLILIRMETALEITNLETREWIGQVEPLGPVGQDRLESTTAHVPFPAETDITFTTPEEMLVADARGGLTPAQMVEQKLLSLLGSGHPGLYNQAGGVLGNQRRLPGRC